MARTIVVVSLASFLCLNMFVASGVEVQTFTYEDSGGCANVLLYGSNRERTQAIVVRADRAVLGLNVGTTTLSLADTPKGLEVRIDLFAKPLPGVDYCTDTYVTGQDKPIAAIRAYSGQVTITLGERGTVKGAQPFMYQATVVLRDLSFKKAIAPISPVAGYSGAPVTSGEAQMRYCGASV